MHYRFYILLLLSILVYPVFTSGQMITGNWKGKIGTGPRAIKVELKLIQKGDSLVGTSYYYRNSMQYTRYQVKGYFNTRNNTVVWWDEERIEEKPSRNSVLSPGEIPLLSEADFNCPGGGKMMLDGNAQTKEEAKEKGPLHLEKTEQSGFNDEWDFVIENYTVGANDPAIIDSVARIHNEPPPSVASTTSTTAVEPKQDHNKPLPLPEPPVAQQNQKVPVTHDPKPATAPVVPNDQPETTTQQPVPQNEPSPKIEKVTTPEIIKTNPNPSVQQPPPVLPPQPENKMQEHFTERKKVLTTELPLEGDTIEIHFYDNAEIDGDSISLFMNNRMVFTHVRLSDQPYIVKFAVNELLENNELVMVAENLGSIPPNTSYMIAYINRQRYAANLESTENSSAMIRFVRKKQQ